MMSRTYRRNFHYRRPNLPRRILGWAAVVAGLVMLVVPGPGLLMLVLGIILLGRRDPVLRRWAVLLRLNLRRLSRAERRTIRCVGIWLRGQHQRARLHIQEQLHCHAQGRPLSLAIRLWIGLTLLTALTGLGVSLYMLLS